MRLADIGVNKIDYLTSLILVNYLRGSSRKILRINSKFLIYLLMTI